MFKSVLVCSNTNFKLWFTIIFIFNFFWRFWFSFYFASMLFNLWSLHYFFTFICLILLFLTSFVYTIMHVSASVGYCYCWRADNFINPHRPHLPVIPILFLAVQCPSLYFVDNVCPFLSGDCCVVCIQTDQINWEKL